MVEGLILLWTDVSNAGGFVGFVPPVGVEDVRPVALAAFDLVGTGHSHIVVARDEGEVVGLSFMEHRPGPLFRHWVTVKRLQVHPSRQGEGIGTALLKACEEHAWALGIEQVHLTARGGTGTEAFYQLKGYELVARIPGVIRVAPGDDREEIYLIKAL